MIEVLGDLLVKNMLKSLPFTVTSVFFPPRDHPTRKCNVTPRPKTGRCADRHVPGDAPHTLVDDKRWLSSSIWLVTSLCVPLGKCIHHIMIYYDILCPMNSWLILHPSHFVEAGQIMSDSYAPHLHPFTSNKTGSATKTLQHPVDPEMPNKQSTDFPL